MGGIELDSSDSEQGQVAGCRENGNEFSGSKVFGKFLYKLIIISFTWRTLLPGVAMRTFLNMRLKGPFTKLHNEELKNFCISQYYTISHFKVNTIGDSCNKHKGDSILTEIFDRNMTMERANRGRHEVKTAKKKTLFLINSQATKSGVQIYAFLTSELD